MDNRIIEKTKKLIQNGYTARQIYNTLLKGLISEPSFKKYLYKEYLEKQKELQREKYKKIVDSYIQNNGRLDKVIVEMKTTRETILKAIKEFDIKKVNNTSNNQRARKNTINEHFFEKIDSLSKAYYLGLMYADGTIHMKENPSRNLVKISLKEEDAYILDEINNVTNFGRKMPRYTYSNNKGKPYVTWAVNSKKMCLDLIDKKCFQKKSLILEFPIDCEFLEKKFLSVFLRGFFDGDGSAGSFNQMAVNFTSSHKFCEQLKKFLSEELCINSRINNRGTYSMIHFKSIDAIKLYHFIYKDKEFKIFLNRKKNIIDHYIDKIFNTKRNKTHDQIEILKLGKILL